MKKVQVKTEKVNKLLSNTPKDSITELNKLISTGSKLNQYYPKETEQKYKTLLGNLSIGTGNETVKARERNRMESIQLYFGTKKQKQKVKSDNIT